MELFNLYGENEHTNSENVYTLWRTLYNYEHASARTHTYNSLCEI